MTNNAELTRIRAIIDQTFKGGAGSGNFGHEGRPGEVGGSAGERSNASDSGSLKKEMDNHEVDRADIGHLNNVVLYGNGEVRISHDGKFIDNPRQDDISKSEKLLGVKINQHGDTLQVDKSNLVKSGTTEHKYGNTLYRSLTPPHKMTFDKFSDVFKPSGVNKTVARSISKFKYREVISRAHLAGLDIPNEAYQSYFDL